MDEQLRYGIRSDEGRFDFRCASCGDVAATLSVSDDDGPVDGGSMPDGSRLIWSPGAPSFRLEFLAVISGPAPSGLVDILAEGDALDPLVLAQVDRDLGAFCCRRCELNYCRSCWRTVVEFDDGFYDCSRGRCPSGHEQMVDD